jgi:hypothetical protein
MSKLSGGRVKERSIHLMAGNPGECFSSAQVHPRKHAKIDHFTHPHYIHKMNTWMMRGLVNPRKEAKPTEPETVRSA